MFGHGGGKPGGKEGEIKITPETNSLFKVCLIPPPPPSTTCTYAHKCGKPGDVSAHMRMKKTRLRRVPAYAHM